MRHLKPKGFGCDRNDLQPLVVVGSAGGIMVRRCNKQYDAVGGGVLIFPDQAYAVVFYSCFSLVFRDRKIKKHYKHLHDTLRKMLADTLQACNDTGYLRLADVTQTADMIFVVVEGAYYYLSMVHDRDEYREKMDQSRKIVLDLLSSGGRLRDR